MISEGVCNTEVPHHYRNKSNVTKY